MTVKWFLPWRENLARRPVELRARYRDTKVRFAVPDLLGRSSETSCGRPSRWEDVREKRQEARSTRSDIFIVHISSQYLLGPAIAMATSFDRTVFDGIAVAHLIATRIPLITDYYRGRKIGGCFG